MNHTGEFFVGDVVDFLLRSWRRLLAASFTGAIIGLTCWYFFGNYSAEYVLLNSNASSPVGLDFVSWKVLQKSLPNLAAQIVEEGKTPENQRSLYKSMSDDGWWKKSVIVGYAISRSDAREFSEVGKELDRPTSSILNLTLTTMDASKQQASENVESAANFIKSGGAFLQLRTVLGDYESGAIKKEAKIQAKITATKLELEYTDNLLKSLEGLQKRYPITSSGNINQLLNSSNLSGKYMPLTTQIIAINADILDAKENLLRLQRGKNQQLLVRDFLQRADAIKGQTYDGLILCDQLLTIENDLRGKLAKDDLSGEDVLNDIRTDLLDVKLRFTKGLAASTSPTVVKKGMFKFIASGLFVAFFLMLAVILVGRVLPGPKRGGAE